jgi:hypothetical protein
LERGSITKYLQQARDLEHGAVEVTEHPLSNAHGSSDDIEAKEMAHIKGARAREKAAEEKYLAKEQAARMEAVEKNRNERSKTAEIASAKADHESKPTSEAVTNFEHDGAVAVTEHPLSSAHTSSDDKEAKEIAQIQEGRAREKAAEEKYLAKEQAARTTAAGKSGKSSKDTVSAETHNERSKTAEVASAKADHEIKPTSEAVTIVRGSTHLANPRNSSAPKTPNPGMLCLQDGGLSDDEMQAFAHSTVCVGWHIKKGMGLGDTKDMIRVRLCLPAILYVHPGSCVIS